MLLSGDNSIVVFLRFHFLNAHFIHILFCTYFYSHTFIHILFHTYIFYSHNFPYGSSLTGVSRRLTFSSISCCAFLIASS